MYVKPGVFTYQHWAVFKNGIGSWSSGYWKNGASTEPQRHVITFSEDKGKQTMYECAKCNAQNKFATASSKYTFTRVDKPAGTTVYTYKKRNKSTVVRYVRWSDWSEYSDNVVSENSDTQVRKRTMYRYKSK